MQELAARKQEVMRLMREQASQQVYQARVEGVSEQVRSRSKEIRTLEQVEAEKVRHLQETKRLEEERMKKLESIMKQNHLEQQQKILKQSEKLSTLKSQYRSMIHSSKVSIIDVD